MTEPSRAKTPLDDSKVTMAVSFGLAGIVLGVGVILLLRIRYKEKKSDTERGALTTGVQAETDAERDQREFEEVHAKWLADPRTSRNLAFFICKSHSANSDHLETSQLRDDSDESYRYPVRPYTFNIPGVMIPEPQQVPRQAHSRQLLSRGNTPGGPRPLSRRSARGSLARSARGFEHRFIPRPISTTISMRSFERPSTIIEESNSSMVSLPDTNVTPTKAGTPRMVLPPLPADPSQPDLVPKPLALRRGATMRESPSGNLNNMTLRRSASDATARSTTQLGHSIQATTNMQERDNSVLSSSIPEGAVEMTGELTTFLRNHEHRSRFSSPPTIPTRPTLRHS